MRKNFVLAEAKNKVVGTVAGVGAALSMAATQTFCKEGVPFATGNVNIDPAGVDAKSVINKIINLLCGAVAVVGILSLINGWSDYTAAKKDDNATGQTKAANKMAISFVEIATPAVVAFLFNK